MEQKHSGIGIASFVTSITVGILVFLTTVVSGIMVASAASEEFFTIVGLLILALLSVDVVALGLGIGGLCQKDRKKIFAILGTVFSSVTVVGTIFLAILGNSM